jgi:hypothetical protein
MGNELPPDTRIAAAIHVIKIGCVCLESELFVYWSAPEKKELGLLNPVGFQM